MSKIVAFVVAVAAMCATAYVAPAHAAPSEPVARIWTVDCDTVKVPRITAAAAAELARFEATLAVDAEGRLSEQDWTRLWVKSVTLAPTRVLRHCAAQEFGDELAAVLSR